MRILIIDTATELGFVALADEKQILKCLYLEAGLRNSKELMPKIDQITKDEPSLDRIIAGNGPGSYTGMRVTAAVSQMIAYAKEIPLVGISSLYAYYPDEKGRFFSLFDARISGLYLAEGERRGEEILWKEPENVPLDQLAKRCEGAKLFTPHERLQQKIDLPLQIITPRPGELFRLGLTKEQAPFKLLYLRDHPAC